MTNVRPVQWRHNRERLKVIATELLNDRVLPFYNEDQIRLCRVLTDRGTEYCGGESHD
jgi:hypothetical protein